MPVPALPIDLPRRAFPAQPRLDRYFAAASAEAARRRIGQCLLRGDGPALLLGAPGVGKSMLVEVIASDLAPHLRVVRLASTQLCTRRALLQAILHGLGAPYRDREEGELRLALTDLLADTRSPAVALLVDEAHSLPVRLLEELRVLTNLAVEGAPRLRLLLAGSHALDEAFTAPELEAFSQRVASRSYLDPLRRDEVASYVRAHLAAAGGDPDRLLGADAYEALVRASEGLPRLINQVGDRALVLAAEEGRRVLDAAAIGAAWSDLHQLAAPWQSPPASRLAAATAGEPTVEFGVLDDETLTTDPPVKPVAVWNAGDKLRELTADGAATGPAGEPLVIDADGDTETDEDDDAPCVAYAFPGASQSTDDVDDALLREADSLFETVAAATHPASRAARDPFAESFDEEEVVIDPFAELERVIPAAPEVVATAGDIGRAFATLDAAYEKDAPAVATWDEPPATADEAGSEDDELLVIEPDDPESIPPAVYREDYAQLFAKLRHG